MEVPRPFALAARAVAGQSATLDEALARLSAAEPASGDLHAVSQASIDAVAREPRYGAALARLADALAQLRGDPDLVAVCGVARLSVENFLGNCCLVTQLGEALAALPVVRQARALRWRVWLELAMAWRQLLLANAPVDGSSRPALLVGLADFAGRARPLPGAQTEIRALAVLLGEAARVVWGEAATLDALRGLSADGTLAQLRILHFAIHGLTGKRSPLESRLLLYAGELTMADVLDLRLNGALVTLSACEAAAGEAGAGDELLNLTRVFFYAGAQTLVASAWLVEDKPTVQLMQGFYWRLKGGDSPARAMQQTQCALAHAGLKPYQWAGFHVVGCP